MGFIMLITFLEEEFGIKTVDSDLIEENFESINAISEFIKKSQQLKNVRSSRDNRLPRQNQHRHCRGGRCYAPSATAARMRAVYIIHPLPPSATSD
jgi:hypothetical protein